MIFVPLPFVVAMLLFIVQIRLLRQEDWRAPEKRPFLLLIGIYALQSVLIGMSLGLRRPRDHAGTSHSGSDDCRTRLGQLPEPDAGRAALICSPVASCPSSGSDRRPAGILARADGRCLDPHLHWLWSGPALARAPWPGRTYRIAAGRRATFLSFAPDHGSGAHCCRGRRYLHQPGFRPHRRHTWRCHRGARQRHHASSFSGAPRPSPAAANRRRSRAWKHPPPRR